MIVGKEILDRGLIQGGSAANLKHSSYDLTVGEIVPIGKAAVKARQKESPKTYYLESREMVWILSKEEFRMPKNVTSLATLRTTFTKNGILALNVGIVDPFFEGPISTALINFSDRPRRIDVGEKFFRVVFFEHNDVTEFHKDHESKERVSYTKELENVSYSDFSKSFLNIPSFDDDFYYRKFWNIVYYGFTKRFYIFWPIAIAIIIIFWYLIDLGFLTFLKQKLEWVKSVKDLIPG